jgi:ribosomal protein S12 methylthiotransferase
MKVGFVSLGCSKNLVDTEMAIGLLKNDGFEIVSDPSKAQMIIVNTCGFIESAKEEAINTIIEMAQFKKKNCKYLIAMGCLVKRYKKELQKSLPEVDLFISLDEYDNFNQLILNLIKKKSNNNTLDYMDRIISTGSTTAFLKIAEGCSNNCTYCAIPYIRGKYISRPFEDIIKEAKQLAKQGIKELIVIAQDTTKYGIDLYNKPRLAELLNELCKIREIKWIRFLYSYPESITDELIEVVANNKKICKYFDMPIQHYSDKVLKVMNRKTTGKAIENIINKIRNKIPNVILRTTLLVGFPGETEEDFSLLFDFVERIKFDKLGVFSYSKEEGTPAAKLKNQIHPQTKKSRNNKIMKLQKEISKELLKEKIGNSYDVLVEDVTDDGAYFIARSYMDIPNEDGVIFIHNEPNNNVIIGEWYNCKIVDILDYDLIGVIK